METIKNPVVIWGNDNFNALGLLRQLGPFDLDLLFLIKGDADVAAKSKYCRKFVVAKTLEDGFAYLTEKYAAVERDAKPILIASGDEVITYVDRRRKDLESFLLLPGTKRQGWTEKYVDKNAATALADELGILCPAYRALTWNSSLDGVAYPCGVKPSRETPGRYNEFKFRVCQNEAALKKTLKYVRRDSVFICQDYVPKEKDLLLYGCRMFDGQTRYAGAFVKDRWDACGSGSRGWIVATIPPSVDLELTTRFLETIDYCGLFSFEFGLVGDKAYFFEVNLRNDGTSHYFYQAGANLPLAYVYSRAGRDWSNVPTSVCEDRLFIDEVFDVENVLRGRVSVKKWKNDLQAATVFKYYDKDDPEPWKAVKKRRRKQIVKELLVEKFRLPIVYFGDKLGLRKR